MPDSDALRTAVEALRIIAEPSLDDSPGAIAIKSRNIARAALRRLAAAPPAPLNSWATLPPGSCPECYDAGTPERPVCAPHGHDLTGNGVVLCGVHGHSAREYAAATEPAAEGGRG